MDKLLIVSADCHATMHRDMYFDYIPSEFHDELATWADDPVRGLGVVAPEFDPALQWTDELRWADLDADGVAAEVLFPQLELPFEVDSHPSPRPELEMAGVTAMNRFMADLVAQAPTRRTAHVVVSFHDIDFTVEEIRKGHANGLRAVHLQPPQAGFPVFYHPRYDPLWAVCDELNMPVVMHGGVAVPRGHWAAGLDEIEAEEEIVRFKKCVSTQMGAEFTWHARRILWELMFGGIFHRFPGLKLVVTESFIDWAPGLMRYLDWIHSETNIKIVRLLRQEMCPELPSEVIRRRVYFGASSMTYGDLDCHRILGADHMMFGVDYPHVEGTTPYSKQWLQKVFQHGKVTEAEARQIAGLTAAELYGFDTNALKPVAEGVGPDLEAMLSDPPVADSFFPERLANQYNRPTGM